MRRINRMRDNCANLLFSEESVKLIEPKLYRVVVHMMAKSNDRLRARLEFGDALLKSHRYMLPLRNSPLFGEGAVAAGRGRGREALNS